jgi:hypothetical protein
MDTAVFRPLNGRDGGGCRASARREHQLDGQADAATEVKQTGHQERRHVPDENLRGLRGADTSVLSSLATAGYNRSTVHTMPMPKLNTEILANTAEIFRQLVRDAAGSTPCSANSAPSSTVAL